MDIGALSLLISERGFDATMAKVAALDTAAAKVGAKQTELKVVSPTALVVESALARVGQTASGLSGTPATIRLTLTGAGEATAALTALAEAEALQVQRATALSAALASVGTQGTDAAQKVATLRAALDQDNASTEKLSAAARALSIAEQEGTEVLRLRVQATNELIAAQNELSRAQNVGARVRTGPVAGGAAPVAVGPQLGPATPEAEAFAARSRATVEAFRREAIEAAHAAALIEDAARAKEKAGNAAVALSPKLRSAANGLTAVAFAATSMNGSMQSIALGAGLAASSLASMASGPVALWAAGIGAAITVGAAMIGIFDRMTDSAANAATSVDAVTRSIQGIKSLSEAQAAAAVNARNLARAEAELKEVQERLRQPASQGPLGLLDFAADRVRATTLKKEIEQFKQIRQAADHQVAENTVREATEAQAARLGIVTEGTAAENRALDAASKAFLATEAAKFAAGRQSLDNLFDARLAAIRASGAREVAAMRERQSLLAEPVADASAADAAKRAAEIRALDKEIAASQARTREESTRTIEERRTQREALDRAFIAFEMKEQEAAGDASEARIAMARQEAAQIARTLVQRADPKTPEAFAAAWEKANADAQRFLATQTAIIRAQQAQTEASREFTALGIEREAIQQRLARGDITEFEAQQQILAAERARIPALITIAAQMERFAEEAKNPELVAAARRLRGEIDAMARAPLSQLQQRIKALKDALSVEAGAGDQGAAKILQELQRDIDANGGKITVGIAVKAEWKKQIKDEIEAQGALLEILIKPKNIILSGVVQALGNLNQQLGGLATNIGDSIGGALAAGFSSAFTKGSGKSFFEAAGNAILQGIGNTMVQLGSAMLTYGLLMAVAGPALIAAGVFTQQAISAPFAIAAGTGLIALGAGLGAIAANNSGHRTGGGGGGRSASASVDRTIAPRQVVLDPDRRLREARDVAPAVAVNAAARAAPAPRPFVYAPTLIGTKDPQVVRVIGEAAQDAYDRNILKLAR